jgi:lipopolysaccharide export system protein LptA
MGMTKLGWMLRGAAAIAVGLAAASPAAAQLVRGANNSNAPIDLTADELEVTNAQCLAVWRGSAEALQADARLRADVLKIYNRMGPAKPGGAGPSCGAVDKIEALGNVYYVTPQQRIRGDNATYDKASDLMVVTGDVVAVQGKNVLRGARMEIHVKTGEAQMQTDVKGRNKPGRVRGVFYPDDKPPAGQTAAPAAAGQ